MKITVESISDVVIPIFGVGAVKVIKYFSREMRVKATRKRYRNDFKGREVEIVLTVGRPNYRESRVIRNALRGDRDFLKNKSLVIYPG